MTPHLLVGVQILWPFRAKLFQGLTMSLDCHRRQVKKVCDLQQFRIAIFAYRHSAWLFFVTLSYWQWHCRWYKCLGGGPNRGPILALFHALFSDFQTRSFLSWHKLFTLIKYSSGARLDLQNRKALVGELLFNLRVQFLLMISQG